MENVCDLHVHSVFSDGTDTPKEIVKKAKKLNIKAVALTDHNTTSGLYEFKKAGKELGVEIVGESKVKIATLEEELPWDDIYEEEADNIEVNEDYLIESENVN